MLILYIFTCILSTPFLNLSTELNNLYDRLLRDIDSVFCVEANLTFLEAQLYMLTDVINLESSSKNNYKRLNQTIISIKRQIPNILKNSEDIFKKVKNELNYNLKSIKLNLKTEECNFISYYDEILYQNFRKWKDFYDMNREEREIRSQFEKLTIQVSNNISNPQRLRRLEIIETYENKICLFAIAYNKLKRLIEEIIIVKEFQKENKAETTIFINILCAAIEKHKNNKYPFANKTRISRSTDEEAGPSTSTLRKSGEYWKNKEFAILSDDSDSDADITLNETNINSACCDNLVFLGLYAKSIQKILKKLIF